MLFFVDLVSKSKDEIRAMFPDEVWAVRNAKKRTKVEGNPIHINVTVMYKKKHEMKTRMTAFSNFKSGDIMQW